MIEAVPTHTETDIGTASVRAERGYARPRMRAVRGAIERRQALREPAYDISEIRFAGRRPPVTCLVHNVSSLGARIEAASAELPNHFILANHAKRLRVVCKVVWRNGREFGVRFVTAPRRMA